MRRIGTGISSFSSFWKKNRFFLLFLTLFFLGALCGAWVIKVDFSEQEAEASEFYPALSRYAVLKDFFPIFGTAVALFGFYYWSCFSLVFLLWECQCYLQFLFGKEWVWGI